MPWFKMSDDWPTHPKTIAAGKDARSLWVITGTLMAKASTDGVIAKDQHQLYAALAGVPWKRNAEKLIEVGFWHDAAGLRSCHACKGDLETLNHHRNQEDLPPLQIGPQDLYWHAWAAHQLPKHRQLSPEARASEDRSRALRKDTQLCQEIQRRDASLCRYCGTRVDWRHRRGPRRATYDHIDPYCYTPAGGNYLEGVVTACGDCNARKNRRTIEEWVAAGGHTLKPPGWKIGDPDPSEAPPEAPPGSSSGPNPDLIPTWSGSSSDLAPTREGIRSGSSPTRAGGRAHPRPGPGQVGLDPGLGLGRPVTGLAGLGRDGPGLDGQGLVGFGPGREPPPGGVHDHAPPPADVGDPPDRDETDLHDHDRGDLP